jgi:hypothetical protein
MILYLKAYVFANSMGSPKNHDFSLFGDLFEWVVLVGRMRVFRFLQHQGSKYHHTTYMIPPYRLGEVNITTQLI